MSTKLIAIEDDVATIHLLRRYLKRADWKPELHHFEYGTDALAFFDSNQDDDLVVLLDLNLPDTSGIDVLRTLRQDDRYTNLDVVVLTTSNLQHEKDACLELGVKYFLEKPFNFQRLIALMQEMNVSFA